MDTSPNFFKNFYNDLLSWVKESELHNFADDKS